MTFSLDFTPNTASIARMKSAIADATEETVDDITEHAKDLAFFGKYATGETKQSISNTVKESAKGVHAEIFTKSGHGGFIEVGTKHNKAEPFLYPAFQRTVNEIFGKLREKLSG